MALVTTAACVRHLPPAPIPEAVLPRGMSPSGDSQGSQASAVQPGQGRLIIDVTDGPTPVQRIRMIAKPITTPDAMTHYALEEGQERICQTTPCVVDLPVGNMILGFPVIGRDETEVELVHVGPDVSAYRRTLSIYADRPGGRRVSGILYTTFGGTAVVTGAALLPVGLAEGINGLTLAGGLSLGIGTAVMTLGIIMLRHDATTYRPGSSNHFSLTAPAR